MIWILISLIWIWTWILTLPRVISFATSSTTSSGSRPGSGPGSGLLGVLDETDLSSIQLSVVQLVHCPLHVRPGSKLHDPLPTPDVVGVGVHDLSGLSHVVPQVLPGCPGGQVLHNQLVSCPLAWRISLPPWWGSSPVPSSSSGVTGVLNLDPVSKESRSIKILDSILGISHVIKLAKSISSLLIPLDYNISNSSIRFEQFLNISVSGVIRDVSEVNFIVSHLGQRLDKGHPDLIPYKELSSFSNLKN